MAIESMVSSSAGADGPALDSTSGTSSGSVAVLEGSSSPSPSVVEPRFHRQLPLCRETGSVQRGGRGQGGTSPGEPPSQEGSGSRETQRRSGDTPLRAVKKFGEGLTDVMRRSASSTPKSSTPKESGQNKHISTLLDGHVKFMPLGSTCCHHLHLVILSHSGVALPTMLFNIKSLSCAW